MKKRSSILLLSIIAASFCSFNTFASDTASSTFSIDVSNAALQVTAPATASIELNPTSSSAVFGSTNITVNVATNNMTGYTITMTVPTTDLTHSTITGDNAPVIPTLQSQAPESTFPANAWGYKVTGDNFNPVQLTNTNPSWVTENPTNGTDHIISLAAKVDGTKHSGTYTNTLTFNVVANPNAARDTIVFDKNNEDATGTMENQTAYQGIATKLNKNNFTLSGMRFAGWSTTASGTGEGVRYYGDESTITTDLGDSSKTITLYAQWTTLPCTDDCGPSPSGSTGTTFQRAYEIAYTAMRKGMYEEQHEGQGDYALVNSWPPDNEPYKNHDVRFAMQDMTPEICASVTAMHDDYQALDIRDNKLYHITKMLDGSCWMTQNLDLDLQHDRILTHANTDLGWTNNDTTATWNPDSNANTITIGSNNSVIGWVYQDYDKPYSASESGDVYYYASGSMGTNDTRYASLASCAEAGHTDCTHYHAGNLYSWPAAIATNDSGNMGANPAPNSICPAGWRLPSISNNIPDFNKLAISEGIVQNEIDSNYYSTFTNNGWAILVTEPFYYTRAGMVGGYDYSADYTTFGGGGNSSSYVVGYGEWTSAYRSIEYSTTGVSGFRWNRYNRNVGTSVRCIAR